MIDESPFTASRFEYEYRHIYYLPKATFGVLEKPKPTYLIGSRGTGKTTLLKAMQWNERLTNESLQLELGGDAFGSRFIGVYLKLPEIQVGAFDEWLQGKGEALYASLFGLFLDLSWVELVAEAIADLLARRILLGSPDQEHRVVDEIIAKYPVLREFLAGNRAHTLLDLARSLSAVRRQLQECAIHRVDPASTRDEFPMGQVGELGRTIAKHFAEICNIGVDSGLKWHFMICMDEAECLTVFQLRVLNTIVRLAEWPAFPIAAFVNYPADITSTVIRNLTLQAADRQLVPLDEMKLVDFQDLAVGVCRVRIRRQLEDPSAEFDVQRVLGRLNINGLLNLVLTRSASPEAKRLLAEAEQYSRMPFFAQAEEDEEAPAAVGVRPPPIYQAYLIDQLGLPVPSPADPYWERRRQDSAELRKKMVAAYLAICHTLSIYVLYASADMIFQLSDNCVRDFLYQIEEIYQQSRCSLKDFLEQTVSALDQSVALRRASLKKRDSIPRSEVQAPKEIGRIVSGLAMITANIQRTSRDKRHLRSSERGLFRVTFAARPGSTKEAIRDLISDAGQAGFLHLEKTEGSTWEFRVHTSLAPAFGFSYRGAYYPAVLSPSAIDRLRLTPDEETLDKAVEDITRQIQDEPTMPLLEGLENAPGD